MIIGGKTALEKAEDKIKAALTSAVQVTDTLWYGGNSTYENVDQLLATPSVQAADVLFAVGGGRVCDTVKVVGEKAGLHLPNDWLQLLTSHRGLCHL